jgi:hypothetical protein
MGVIGYLNKEVLMARISIRSAKNKGRRLQNMVKDILLEKTKCFGLVDGDIQSSVGSENGRDIKLSPLAEKIIPFDCECKNKESISIKSAIIQSKNNSINGRIPIVIFKKNRSKIYSIISKESMINIIPNITDEFNVITINKDRLNIWNIILENEIKLGNRSKFVIYICNNIGNYYIIEFEILLNFFYRGLA